MTFDDQGLLWLSDPWIAVLAFGAVLGLLLWSHAWAASGRPPRPRAMAVRVRRPRRVRPALRNVPLTPPAHKPIVAANRAPGAATPERPRHDRQPRIAA